MKADEEPYLTIKELSWELQKIGLPSSRMFIYKYKNKNPKIWKCNRVKFSEFFDLI